MRTAWNAGLGRKLQSNNSVSKSGCTTVDRVSAQTVSHRPVSRHGRRSAVPNNTQLPGHAPDHAFLAAVVPQVHEGQVPLVFTLDQRELTRRVRLCCCAPSCLRWWLGRSRYRGGLRLTARIYLHRYCSVFGWRSGPLHRCRHAAEGQVASGASQPRPVALETTCGA